MMVITDIDDLTECVSRRVGEEPWIVAVEGASGSGKTTVAERLAKGLGAKVLSTDGYYQEGVMEETYVEGLRLRALRQKLTGMVRDAKRVVIEGITLRDTMTGCKKSADVTVYCKRISQAGIWNDDPELDQPVEGEMMFGQEVIDCWSHEYHGRVRPDELADFIFESGEGGDFGE